MASSVTNVIANRFPHTTFLHPAYPAYPASIPAHRWKQSHLTTFFYFRPVLALHSVDKNQFHRLRGDLQLQDRFTGGDARHSIMVAIGFYK